jgi:hypothetical protein
MKPAKTQIMSYKSSGLADSLFATALFALLTCFSAQAQRIAPEIRASKYTSLVVEALEIKDTILKNKINTINLRSAIQMDSVSDLSGINTIMLKKEGAKLDKKRDAELEELLDDLQWSVYKKKKPELVGKLNTELKELTAGQ